MENKKQKREGEFLNLRKQLAADFGKRTEEIKRDINKNFEKHTGILYEKFRDDVKQVAELTLGVKEKVDKIENKLDATFEMTGNLAIDLELVKSDVETVKGDLAIVKSDVETVKGDIGTMKRDIEITKQDTNFIKNGLKKKVDREEFEALDRRVAIVEAKFIPKQT